MSTIKLELTVDANNIEIVTEFLGRIAVASVGAKKVADMRVIDAEEVKVPEPEKSAAKPRPSRAKAKPEPAPAPEPEDDDELDDPEFTADDDELEAEDITADDLRELQATKVDKHRDAIKAQLVKLGATGIKNLAEENFQKYFDFLSKLK